MYKQAIDEHTERVFRTLALLDEAKKFYLAGGTALALQLGHRLSVDLDCFSQEDFSNNAIKRRLALAGNFSVSGEEEGTIHGVLDEVKVSFLYYPYKLLFPLLSHEGLALADARDIVAMKLDAVSSRGTKKDFFDMYALLQIYSLEELLSFFEKKYTNIQYNRLHILKSLVYFQDAQEDPDPMLLGEMKNVSWEEVQEKLRTEAYRF